MVRTLIISTLAATALGASASAATLSQTIHFSGADAADLFALYSSANGQEQITGLPARYSDASGAPAESAEVGGRLNAFCFEPEMCALDAAVLAVQESPGRHTIVMSWWNFGWVQANDPADYSVENRGAPDSILTLTFSDTPSGAQIELVQANVPDYAVTIPNPDGSQEVGPLSRIVNTHWNTLYWDGFRRALASQ